MGISRDIFKNTRISHLKDWDVQGLGFRAYLDPHVVLLRVLYFWFPFSEL